ncbi:unnamed protein product [Adineta ricciae]|uniref:Uncharacterized protein n=1 Tax=Adineta ricciae TaxID=249248 RepID=A0A814ZAW3_ADIRI|nr:unnamed protein product [Adineta ricciae]
MSSSTTTTSPNRKRPISSSIRSSPSPPSAKRHGLANSRRAIKATTDQANERHSRTKRQYRHVEHRNSSWEFSQSSSNSNHSRKSPTDDQNANEFFESSIKHSKSKSDMQMDMLYTKKATSLALIMKPSAKTYHSDDEYEQSQQISTRVLNKSTPVIVPPSVMTIVKSNSELSKKSFRQDNVIIQQYDTNSNSNSSAKLVKLIVPQTTNSSSPSIKMLSSGDGLASALRIPTKIQLTKPLLASSTRPEKSSSLISSTNVHQDQLILSPSSATNLLDVPDQQSVLGDYHSPAALPPTPPPPVIDNTNSNLRNVSDTLRKRSNKTSTMNTKGKDQKEEQLIASYSFMKDMKPNFHFFSAVEKSDEPISDEAILPKRHSSTSTDWSVPPTSELSPTSLTSSSPDLTQNYCPTDDSFVELDSSINIKDSVKRQSRSLSTSYSTLPSFTTSYLQSNDETFLKPNKSKSLTRPTANSDGQVMLINKKRSLQKSPTLQAGSSQCIKRRRRANETPVKSHYNEKLYKSKTKHFKLELNDEFVIKDLLFEMIERVVSTSNDQALKTLLNTSISNIKQIIPIVRVSNRKTTFLRTNKKTNSSKPNESRSKVITQQELDEQAYLLHTKDQRGNYERVTNPAKVEERMLEMWSEMSEQKKNIYYKRVIQLYKKPNRDVVITSSSLENHSFLSTDSTDNTNSSTLSISSLSVDFKRQTSTPLSFHSVPSSINDDQSTISSNESSSKTNISSDIVNELINGAKGLDRLSSSPTVFIDSIQNFVRLPTDKQIQTVRNLEQQLEKKCSTQLNRANIFCTQKINYFATKYQISSSNESKNELTLIVKYFYFFVLSLNCQKQEGIFQTILTQILNGNYTSIDESYCSPVLTSVIEDLILCSSLANDYLASQPMIMNDVEYSLPCVRNSELENELTHMNLSSDLFTNANDLQDYLNRCENATINIPCYSVQQSQHSSMYYPTYHSSSQYYYPPSQSNDMNNYYYNTNPSTPYPHSSQMFSYNQSTSYYHPADTYANNNNNEKFKYYYNPQQSTYPYSSQVNSTTDIPISTNSSLHRSYHQMNPNLQRTFSNSQQPTTSSPVFDSPSVVSPQVNFLSN